MFNIIFYQLPCAMMAKPAPRVMGFRHMLGQCGQNRAARSRSVPQIQLRRRASCLTICSIQKIGRISGAAFALRVRFLAKRHLPLFCAVKFSPAQTCNQMTILIALSAIMLKAPIIRVARRGWGVRMTRWRWSTQRAA